MAVTTATPDRLAKVQGAIAFLRAAGREEEARAVESLLPSPKPRRLPPTPPISEHDLVPIAEAATRLGLSRNAVQRRIDSGLLEGARDESNRYRFVTRASLDTLVESQRILANTAHIIGDSDEEHDPDSLLAQMLRAAEIVDPIDEEDGQA